MEVAKKANKTENAEQRKAYMKAYRESKKEEMKQYFREYYKTNKEELNEKHKAYNKETRARQRELRKEKKNWRLLLTRSEINTSGIRKFKLQKRSSVLQQLHPLLILRVKI